MVKRWTTREDFRRDIEQHIREFEDVWKKDLDAAPDLDYLDNRTSQMEKDNMNITTIRVTKKLVQNLGDYNSAHFEFGVDAQVAEGEDVGPVTDSVVEIINAQLKKQMGAGQVSGGGVTVEEVPAVAPTIPETPAPAAPETPAPETPAPAAPETPAPAAPETPADPFAGISATPAAPAMSSDDFQAAVIQFMGKAPNNPDIVGQTLAKFGIDRVPNVPEDKRQAFVDALGA